jgi:hypothetical protein
MRVGPVRQNLADEFDPRRFRPSRDGLRLLPRMRHRRGGRSGGAQFRAETGRGGSSFPRRPVLPPPPSLSRPTEEQRGGWIRRRRVDVGAGRGERGPLLTSAPSAVCWPRAQAPAAQVRKAGSDATRRFVQGPPAVAPSDSAVNGNQPRGPERASSAGPQAQELCPDVPRVRALRPAARPSRPVPIDYAGDLNLQVVVLQTLDTLGWEESYCQDVLALLPRRSAGCFLVFSG